MNLMEMMNYRFENPKEKINVDKKIAEKFIERDRDNIEMFELWASVSKESNEIAPIINNYIRENAENKMTGHMRVA